MHYTNQSGINWISGLMDSYYNFLKEKTVVTECNSSNWVEISTPFVGLFNDSIDIYAKRVNGAILLSDDSQTLRDLQLSGMEFSRSEKRRQMLEKILVNYGVRLENDELVVEATVKDFPQKKLNLISAISEISDLAVMASHTVASVFMEDVRLYLDNQGIIYTPHFISRGSAGIEFTFDFQIAGRESESVIKSFNSLNTTNLPKFLFTWQDIRPVREKLTEKSMQAVAVINDIDREVKPEYLQALDTYGASYILWSQRDRPEHVRKLKIA